jgi:hypothetical protein
VLVNKGLRLLFFAAGLFCIPHRPEPNGFGLFLFSAAVGRINSKEKSGEP